MTGRRDAGDTRPAFPIGLIALDLDGTLIGDDLLLRDRTTAAIRAAIERGVSVSIVTGRMATSALRFARELGLRDPIVGYQGALIRAMPEPGDDHLGRLLLHRPLAAAATREAIEWTRSIGLDPHVNHLEKFIIRADDPRAEDYSSFLGGRAVVVDDLLAWVKRPVSKVIAVAEEPMDHAVLDVARERFAGRRRGHDQPSAVPRVPQRRASPRVRRSAGSPVGRGCRSRTCLRSATSSTTWR